MQATGQGTAHRFERFLVILGAALCLALTVWIWRSVRAYQPMWPLPALYFIEIVAVGILGAFLFLRGGPRTTVFTWAAAGIFSAFSILGALSVGVFYVPVVLLFAVASMIADLKEKRPMAAHLGVFLIAGLVQAAVMLAVVRVMEAGAIF